MKVYQAPVSYDLSFDLKQLLNFVRFKRCFVVQQYVDLKCKLLNSYMRQSGLNTCIIAVSGGVDSAAVLALVNHASKMENSPIKKIVPVALPCFYNHGVTNQESATSKAVELCESIGVSLTTIDIHDTVETIVGNNYTTPSDWALGQLVPYTRTPYLYYLATLLTDAGNKAIIMGTTNRDEGSFLGFLGKASDGISDVNLISDIHKSEVYQVAKYLNVPSSIVKATPNGDMFDNRPDVEVFGAPYDFVEMYLNHLSMNSCTFSEFLDLNHWDAQSIQDYAEYSNNLEVLHNYNKHKYFVGSPSVALDLLESGVPNGWALGFTDKYYDILNKIGNITKSCFVSPFESKDLNKHFSQKGAYSSHQKVNRHEGVTEIYGGLYQQEINILINEYFKASKEEAGVDGYVSGEKGGSLRCSTYSVELSTYLWNVIRGCFTELQEANEPVTDWKKGEIWKAVGVNPLMRFIGYNDLGKLVPHYDYSFQDSFGYKSLYSVVIYLTDNRHGATRFYKDDQADVWEKNLNDKSLSFDGEIHFQTEALSGKIVIFPHHLLHDSEPINDEFKLIIRTDIMFEKVKFSGE